MRTVTTKRNLSDHFYFYFISISSDILRKWGRCDKPVAWNLVLRKIR